MDALCYTECFLFAAARCTCLCHSQLKCGFIFQMFQLSLYGKRCSIIHRSVRAIGKLQWVIIGRCVIIYVCPHQFLQAFHYSIPEARGLSLNRVGTTTQIQNVAKNGRKLLATGFKSRRWNATRPVALSCIDKCITPSCIILCHVMFCLVGWRLVEKLYWWLKSLFKQGIEPVWVSQD